MNTTKERYEAFVTKNEPLVRKLQEVANILVFLLPGNTVDGELAQEAGLAAINLFVIYHNLLFEAKKKCALASQTGRKGGLAAAQVAVRASRVSMLPNTTTPPTPTPPTPPAPTKASPSQEAAQQTMHPPKDTTSRSALRLALTICAHTEVVAEMVAIRLVGDANKWPVITMIEGLKSFARTWLLTTADGPRVGEGSGDRNTLLGLPRVQHHGCQYPSTSNEPLAGPFSAPPGAMPPSSSSETPAPALNDPTTVMRHTMDYRHRHRRRWSHNNILASVSRSVSRSVSAAVSLPTPQKIVRIGELLHIMRPLVYALCRWRVGAHKWTPLLVSGLMDFFSASCTDIAAAVQAHLQGQGKEGAPNPTLITAMVQAVVGRHVWGMLTVLFGLQAIPAAFAERQNAAMYELYSFEDRAEFNRRRALWMYYLLRDPLFDRLTRPMFAKVAGVLSYIPLVGGLADYAMFSLEYYQKKHFWFSGSSSGR